jgi:CheY-like chemotaxis protein
MLSGKLILIVEDRASTRDAMRFLLEGEGYRVACAANGREALDYLYADDRPFVILLDLNMPVMDGWQFRHEQRRDPALAGIAVVLVSSSEADLPQIAASLGAAGHFAKPVEFDLLLGAVRRLCA